MLQNDFIVETDTKFGNIDDKAYSYDYNNQQEYLHESLFCKILMPYCAPFLEPRKVNPIKMRINRNS